MSTFYAIYPINIEGSGNVQTVQGEGTPGSQTGGLLTVQGDPSGTPVPISGNITASSASVGPTGSSVPADADYLGISNSGNLIGAIGDSSGRQIIVGAGTAGSSVGGVVSIQGVSSGTTVPVTGTVTATVASVGATGSSVPADADYLGLSNGGTLIGAVGDSSGRIIVVGAGTAGSGSGGVITVQGSASGTAIPVTVSSLSPTTPTTAVFSAEGNIAAGSITSSYQTVFTPASNTKILYMRNNTNASITVSMDAGTTINWILDSGDQVSIDFQSNAMVCTTTAIQIKSSGSPSTGSFRVNGVHT